MSNVGGQPGNQNAAKGKLWANAIKRAVARKFDGDLNHGLDKLAEKLIDAVAEGDLSALKEFGDRLDGKPAQALIGGSDDDPAIKTFSEIVIRAVDATRPPEEGS